MKTGLAAALTAALLCTAAPATADTTATTSACTWQQFTIFDRHETTCRKAKRILGAYYGGGSTEGYTCRTTASSGYRAGKCKRSRTKYFRFRA